jgi:cyclic beta-1,2-glucan synthetase
MLLSAAAVAQFLLLLFALAVPGGGTWWIALVAVLLVADSLFFTLPRQPVLWAELGAVDFVRARLRQLAHASAKGLSILMIAPTVAHLHIDAVLRACWRTFVSRKHMLEWVPHGELAATGGPGAYLRLMCAGPVAALLVGGGHLLFASTPLPLAALALIFGWFVAPLACWWGSRPAAKAPAEPLPDAPEGPGPT